MSERLRECLEHIVIAVSDAQWGYVLFARLRFSILTLSMPFNGDSPVKLSVTLCRFQRPAAETA